MSVFGTESGAMKWWILSLAIIVTSAVCAIGGNNFPVISYQDRDDKGMKNDTFYHYLDSFGVSEFFTFNADTAGYWKEYYGHDIDYYFHHSRQHQWAYLDDDSLLHVWSAFKSAHCAMDAANENEIEGYFQPLNTSVTSSEVDQVVDTLVLKSLVSLHSPGFMHGAFTKGQFQYTSHRKQDDTTEVWDLIMAVDLRMPDTTAPDTVLVAQMVFENQKNYVSGSTWDQCDGEVSPYSVIRYNDSLILRWDGTALDTFQVYDTSDVEAVISYCGDDVKSQALPSYFDSVCYLDGTTLYCTAPIKFVKDIWDTSFQNPNSYQTFTMSCIGKVGWAETFDYKVYWTGAKDLYLYKLYFYDEKGFVFDSLTSNDLAGAQANLDAWYADHTYASGNIKALRVVDEPAGPEFQNLDKFRQIVAGVSSGTPTEALGTLGSYNNSDASRYYDMYLRYGQVDKFHFDYYANLAYFSSSSQPNDTFNIQLMLNNYVSKYDIANTRARANNAAWQVILPTFDAWEKVDSVTYCKYRRMPTGNEIRAMANLALAYGARGIGYWPYISNVKPDKSPTSDLSVHERYLGTLPDTMPNGDFLPLASFDDPNACPPCSCTSVSEHDRNALVYDQTGLPYGIWWDVRDVNRYLDSMAYFFNNATWRSAGSASTVSSLSSSFIDSIKTLDTRFSNDSAFIELSFFTYTNETYAYVVNRRVDDGTYDWVDSQTVKIYMPGEGAYEIWDAYKNQYDTLWDSAGVIQWSRHLEPGGAVLLKSTALKTTWSGTVGSQWYWNIPAFATINMTGDITVPYGTTLSIDRARFKVVANSDDQSSGQSTTKSEFQVSGTLRVTGSGTSRPILGPASASDSAWYGITAYLYGKVIMDNAVIKNAYRGVYLSGYKSDTVKNCRFEDCFMYGIYTRSDSSYIFQDTFLTVTGSSTGHGIYSKWSDAPAAISDCYFEDVKYPIRIWAANAPISNCEFRTTEFSGASGTAAITFDTHGDPTITTCDFYGYGKGIQLAYSSDIEVYGSSFQNVDTDDRMYVAIYGAPTTSSLYSESNCFMSAWDAHVVNHKTTCQFSDDGLADDGANSFNSALEFFKSSKDQPDTNMVPPWAIINDSAVSVVSWSDHWRTRAEKPTPIEWVKDGNATIYAPSYSDISMYCPDPAKGESPAGSITAETDLLPERFELHQNYPNPFNMTTIIPFSVPRAALVKLEIFNLLGQRIQTLCDGVFDAGEHTISWDGQSLTGDEVSSGVYFYRLVSDNVTLSRKMIVLK